jgi:hypothetical protein
MVDGRYAYRPFIPSLDLDLSSTTVAPHYFKPTDLEALSKGEKKMPNQKGAASSGMIGPT